MKTKTQVEWKPLIVAMIGALLLLGLLIAFIFALTSHRGSTGAVSSMPGFSAQAMAPGAVTSHSGTSSGSAGSEEEGTDVRAAGSTPGAPATAPSTAPTAPVPSSPVLLASLSGSSEGAPEQSSSTFPIVSSGRLIARVTMRPIDASTIHYVKGYFVPRGETFRAEYGCFSAYDEMDNQFVLAQYNAGDYYLHISAMNCTYSVSLEQQP